MARPDAPHAVVGKDLVGAKQGEVLLERLGDEQAIEGIAMMKGQMGDALGMGQG